MRAKTTTTTGLALIAGAAGLIGCAAPEPTETAARPGPALSPMAADVERSQLREAALDVLGAAVNGPDAQLRANAIEGLGPARGRLSAAAALGLTDDNEAVRATAAMMVGRERLRELTPSVRPLLRDRSGFVRTSAVYAMARAGAPVDRTPLASALLDDPRPAVRRHAAFVLGELGDPSAVPLLRSAAASGRGNATPNEDKLFQLQIAEAMIKLGEREQVSTVLAALFPSRPEDLEATALAAQILGEAGDRGSAGQLIALTAYTDGGRKMPAEVRLAAARALAQLGNGNGSFIADEHAASPLPAVRAQAAHVYGLTLDPRRGAGPLERMLGDENGLVRVAAAAAVLELTDRAAGASAGAVR